MSEQSPLSSPPLGRTESVCPVCLKTVAAELARDGDTVSLVKQCPDHGVFRAPVWRGEPALETWRRPKIPATLPVHYQDKRLGCPYDCGLCPEHGQRTCVALLEVTDRCQLGCPVCFARSGTGSAGDDPPLSRIGFWYDRVAEAGGQCNIQLSGGEATLRDDLPAIVSMGQQKGFSFIQLNTNGIRLASDEPFVRALRDAGLSSVFLQFDGTDDAIHERLRGRKLLAVKRRAIEQCDKFGIGVVLVPTLAPGVNMHDLGNIVSLALASGPTVRGVHFQPISYFGRYGDEPGDTDRVTLPEVMRALEEQTGGMVRARDFSPPGCEHSQCSFHCDYLRAGGILKPMPGAQADGCCTAPPKPSDPIPAEEGARASIACTARQWAAPPPASALPDQTLGDFDLFLERVKTGKFSLSAMAFQDAWTLDLERLKGCCIHCVSPDGRLIPFCAYNLTSTGGRALYRSSACSR